jgi:tRNA(Ile)-lysidine synthase TilS/MesJ
VQVIRPFLEKHNIEDTVFAIGVSGGADSLALALMFKQEYPNYKIIALTVDHQLRPTSRQEADYVAFWY